MGLMDNVKPTEIAQKGEIPKIEAPPPQDVKSFFEKVRQDDINDRKLANQTFGGLKFVEARDGASYVLNEVTADLTNKKVIREIGRVSLGENGAKSTEEFEYFARSNDGASILRKTNQVVSAESGSRTIDTRVYEAPTVDNLHPAAGQLLEQSRNISTLNGGNELSSVQTNFSYATGGALNGETITYRNADKSTETVKFEGNAQNLIPKTDVTVYGDATPAHPHQNTKTYENVLNGQQQLVPNALLDVEQNGATTTETYFVRNSQTNTWSPTKQTIDSGNGPKQSFPIR